MVVEKLFASLIIVYFFSLSPNIDSMNLVAALSINLFNSTIDVADYRNLIPLFLETFLQEVLIVAIGNRILKIDTTKVGRGKEFSTDDPLKCPVEKVIDGIQFIGKHEGDVTDLSISQWMTTRLASASKDGTVCISPS